MKWTLRLSRLGRRVSPIGRKERGQSPVALRVARSISIIPWLKNVHDRKIRLRTAAPLLGMSPMPQVVKLGLEAIESHEAGKL